jgi:3-phenylpropionate/trans-cinnamate dioxygenase ferredoxin reductase subunit
LTSKAPLWQLRRDLSRNDAMTGDAGVLILGAGQAAAQAVHSLRHAGYDKPIVVAGEEPYPPYQRPPLSKAYLLGQLSADHLELKGPDFWRATRAELRLNARAAGIDLATKQVAFADGASVRYDTLILALGARARRLAIPGAELDGVMTLRTRSDSDALRARLETAKRVVVVGGGFIGLEIAAAARAFGAEVVVLEAARQLMARTCGSAISDFYVREHARHGVDVRLASPPTAFEGRSRVEAVALADGMRIAADLVVVGIGATPNVEIATAAGLACEDGVVADEAGRTGAPAVYAIGDVAASWSALYRRRMRLESVQNAIDGAKAAAAAIAGATPPPPAAPWNWSDQYDLKLQIAGIGAGFDREVLRGEASKRAFAAFYFAGDRLLGCDAVNAPAEFVAARQLIARGTSIDLAALADASKPMKSFLETV